jgi:hypothetical protein
MFLAYPYGGYNNSTVLAAVKNAGFVGARTVDPTTDYVHYTLNSPDILTMKNYEAIGGIDNDATIINQINKAIAVNGLLILSFHKIVDNLSADENNSSTEYRVSDFQNVSNYLKNSNVDVRTLSDYFGIIPKLAPIVNNTTPIVTSTTPIVNATAPIVTSTTPIVNATAPIVTITTPIVTATTPIVNATTPIVTSTPNLAKYTSESKGSSSGYSAGYNSGYYKVTPPKPTPKPNIIKTPIPTETPDFNKIVTTVTQATVKENIVRKEEKPKSIFENIVDYFEGILNYWRKYFK